MDNSHLQLEEEKNDVAFQILLLMIDIFYSTYPEYTKLFDDYLDTKFHHSKVYVSLVSQVRQIGAAFDQDFSSQNRIWLVQTLSYFHVVLKILRISYVQQTLLDEENEQDERRKAMQANIRSSNKNLIANFMTIEEEEAEIASRSSADFGDKKLGGKKVAINDGGSDELDDPMDLID